MSFDPTFEVAENGGVMHVLQEETMVLHGRWTYCEANSRDGGVKTKPVATTTTTKTTTTVAWQAKKIKNKQKNNLETRLEPGKNS